MVFNMDKQPFKLAKVELTSTESNEDWYKADEEQLTLIAESGDRVVLALTGDCCSGSYFEAQSVKDVQGLVGQTIVGIEAVKSAQPNKETDDGLTQYHAIKITTNQETVVVDWRNESNGFYDGECTIYGWPKPDGDKVWEQYRLACNYSLDIYNSV